MSDEPQDLLEKFITDFSVAFPIVSSKDAGAKYQIAHYPTHVLVAADGTLLVDMDSPVDEALVQRGLADVVLVPPAPDSSNVRALAKAIKDSAFHKVSQELAKLSEKELTQVESDYVDLIRGIYDKRVAAASAAVRKYAEGPDYFAASQQLEKIAKRFDGLPVAAEAEAELDRFKDDKAISQELKAGKTLAAVLAKYDPKKRSDAKKLVAELEKFVKRFEGSHAAEQAQATLGKLQK